MVTSGEASEALGAVDAATRRMAAEVGLPRWYWWVMGGGWLGMGVLSDLAPAWVASAATLGFGMAHASLAPRLLHGRQRTDGVRVSADVAGRHVGALVLALLLVLVGLGVGVALVLDADGARHAAIWAGLIIGILAAFGGPDLLAAELRGLHRGRGVRPSARLDGQGTR